MSLSSNADTFIETARRSDCPCWCETNHDAARGEDDWVHESAPIDVEDNVLAKLCMTVHPESGITDGPFVILGSRELTIEQAAALGVSFIGLAAAAATSSRRGEGGTRSLDL